MAVPAASDPLTFWQAISALTPLIGAGGISAMVVAYFAYRAAAREGKPARLGPVTQTGLAVLVADAPAIEALGMAIGRLATAAELLAKKVDDIDAKPIRDAVEEIRDLRHTIEDLRGRERRR